MAEKQSAHRQYIEAQVIRSNVDSARMGLFFGFAIGTFAITGAVLCILFGHDVAGTTFGGVGITSLVSVFVYGRHSQKSERMEKEKMRIERTKQLPKGE